MSLEHTPGVPERPQGILLIAHGSRRPAANADLVTLADMVRGRCPDAIVTIGYLELTTPSIPDGAAACIAAGAGDVWMLPFFLSAGTHVASDLEEFREQFVAAYPGHQFRVCGPLGLHPLIVEVLLARLAESDGPGVSDAVSASL